MVVSRRLRRYLARIPVKRQDPASNTGEDTPAAKRRQLLRTPHLPDHLYSRRTSRISLHAGSPESRAALATASATEVRPACRRIYDDVVRVGSSGLIKDAMALEATFMTSLISEALASALPEYARKGQHVVLPGSENPTGRCYTPRPRRFPGNISGTGLAMAITRPSLPSTSPSLGSLRRHRDRRRHLLPSWHGEEPLSPRLFPRLAVSSLRGSSFGAPG